MWVSFDSLQDCSEICAVFAPRKQKDKAAELNRAIVQTSSLPGPLTPDCTMKYIPLNKYLTPSARHKM